jgi:hypothetical protein
LSAQRFRIRTTRRPSWSGTSAQRLPGANRAGLAERTQAAAVWQNEPNSRWSTNLRSRLEAIWQNEPNEFRSGQGGIERIRSGIFVTIRKVDKGAARRPPARSWRLTSAACARISEGPDRDDPRRDRARCKTPSAAYTGRDRRGSRRGWQRRRACSIKTRRSPIRSIQLTDCLLSVAPAEMNL